MPQSPDLTQPQQRILKLARDRFFEQGFSKVTMDELANELGMSKKTLYKHFPQKGQLLRAVVDCTLDELRAGVEGFLQDDSLPFLQKLEALLTFVGMKASSFLQPNFLRDVQRKAPEIWQRIEAFRREMVHTRFSRLIGQGVANGVFRDDIDQDLVVMVYFNTIQTIINPQTLANLPFTPRQVFDSLRKLLFEGLLTEDARRHLLAEGKEK